MVDATSILDPTVIPTVMLSKEELDEAEVQIELGNLPRDWFPRYYEALRKNIFGQDYKKDKDGNPIEQGLGSRFNQTEQSVAAFKKWHKDDPDFEKKLAVLEAQLAESNARRGVDRVNAKPNKHGRLDRL
jgi:hypothetical protein